MRPQREVAEASIRQQVDRLVEGIQARDLDALRQVYAADLISFDVEPPLQHVAVEAKLRNWAGVFALFQDLRYEVRDLTLTVGDDVAFGHGFGRISGRLGNGTSTSGMWVRLTLCFRKIDGGWWVVHDHASVPFDLPTGRGVTDLQP